MPSMRARVLAIAAVVSWAILPGAGQRPSLRIVSASPNGDLGELADADEIQVVFSEPMIALGTAPTGAAPSWIRIVPDAPGSFYWSGTKTLAFSPDVSRPLPFATTFTVRVDAAATSVAGRALSAAYQFTFTTPTPRLLQANWYRKTGRFDSAAVIALRFNQPVRPEDVAAHAHVALTPHPWTAPMLSAEARERLRQMDPVGLGHFDEKVATVARVASSSDAVAVRVADTWDERQFPVAPEHVVLETITAPPTDGWLTVTMDGTFPSAQGPETHAVQSTIVQLEPTFFVEQTRCTAACDPSQYNPIHFTGSVTAGAMAHALTIADVTVAADERPVTVARDVGGETERETRLHVVQELGFEAQPPARTWRLHLDGDLSASDGQTLGYPWVAFVENAHERPFIALEGAVWEASGGPLVPVTVRNVESITKSIARVAASSMMPRLKELSRLSPNVMLLLAPLGRTARLGAEPDAVRTLPLDVRSLLSSGGTGIVQAEVSPESPRSGPLVVNVPGALHSLIQVTNLGISVKDSPQSTLVFVTRLDSGAPVPDARVAIVDTSNQTRWRGRTDRDGVALAPALALRQPDNDWDLSFIVTAEKDGDEAFVGSDWYRGVHPAAWKFNYSRNESVDVLRGRVFTDRAVYKEKETVHIKAVMRDDTPAGMRLVPAGGALDVFVRDSWGREVDRRTVEVNRWSSAEWTWVVPADAALGYYSIQAARAHATRSTVREHGISSSFLVAAYRRPDFRVDATLTGDPAILGSTLHGTIDAKYLFGGALGVRPVRWWFRRELVQRTPDAVRERYPDAQYAVGYLPRAEPRREETSLPTKTEALGADGRIRVALPTPEGDAAYSYMFEGNVEDVSGQHIANRASLVVHPASLYVAMRRPPTFVDTKAGTTLGVVAVDLFGTPVAGVPVTVSLIRAQYVATRRSDSSRSGEWARREIPSGEWTVRTIAGGDMPLPIPVRDGGYYTLRAIARDANGRQTRTEVDFYALGQGLSSWRRDGDRFDLTPERKTWKPGETARILIQSPWPRATALLTVEREGIRSHRTFTIASTQDTVEVPITEADIPNVYVSVMLVKGRTATELAADGGDEGQPSYCVGYTELVVDDSAKRLRVGVSVDRDEYRPREPVKVSVAVTAPDRAPASAEVTLWAVDYALLSLTNYTTPDVLKAIYVPKALQVLTEDNRQRLISRRPLANLDQRSIGGVEGGVMGGVAGGIVDTSTAMTRETDDLAEAPPDVPIRQDFRPLVFWLGSMTTGADGRATTTVTLPDSLTTYRIMAVAGDQASQFGFGEREIRVTKPLTLLPAFPRFLAKGDRAAFGAVVTNSGKDVGNAVVTIESLDPSTLKFGAVATQTLPLAPGASASVKFDALALASGRARVRVIARMGADTDGLELPLAVTLPMRPETTAAYGDTTSTAIETVALPAGVLPGVGGLTVELASTALVGLGESARYLDQYPYDCAEQIASRALALLLASDLGGAFTLSGVKPAEYRAAGAKAVNALYAYHCSFGGFSLWAGACESQSPYLTAYVLHVLKVAKTLQVPVDSRVVDHALGYLERELRQSPPDIQWWPAWGASQAFSVKVLAEFGRNPRDHIRRLAGMAERLPVFALSYLADALAASNDNGPRYQDVVRRLTNALRIDADRAHVEEIDDAALAWLWNTNVRATAVVVDGFARRKDAVTLVAPLVRWLVAARTNGRWGTTHENAMALEALVAYYRAFESDAPRMRTAVKVGSTTVGTAAFNGRSTTAQQVRMSMADLLKQVTAKTSPTLSISRTGTGRVYYTARVQSFAPEPPEAVDRGFRVERHYERYTKDTTNPSTTSFDAGDLVRVTVAVTLRGEGRYLALTDPLPAGFEPLEGWFKTTASDLARAATRTSTSDNWLSSWRRGDFDHVEKHDDRVVAFATRLGSGRHEFSYLVRATTAGTFGAPGARVEAMYAPELSGRSQAAAVTVR